MPRSESGYRFLDHTADILMEAWAPDEAGLLAIAAAGVVNAMTEGASVGDADSVTLEAEGLDPEDRLVTWLNEIIALAVCDGFLYLSAHVVLRGETELTATIRGESGGSDHIRTELKSATYHDLTLEETADGWRCRVVIDV